MSQALWAREELTELHAASSGAMGPAARDFIFLYEDFGEDFYSAVAGSYAGKDSFPTFTREMRKWYVLEALERTLEMKQSGRK